MGQFKPMVKMMTTEPSVILKLKKGGKVQNKNHEMDEENCGHKAMNAGHHEDSEHGNAPKKPSMAERRKAMNPNFKKGGKVAHKAPGGMMPMGGMQDAAPDMAAPSMPMPAMPMPMKRRRVMAMNPQQSMDRRAMLKKAITGMKKGGGMESQIEKLQEELHHHESMPMGKAHKMQHKADGGAIDSNSTKTTIKGNAGKYCNTEMNTAEHGSKAKKGSGDVKMGNGGGYADGGTIKGNAGKYLNTDMVTAENGSKAKKGTGGVKMGNAGGFKKGGDVDCWENRPANTSKAGKSNTTTGGVKNGNGGGYMMGGSTKKAYATGGTVDTGKAVAMPKKPMSRPVANSLQSGTFKKGGKVDKFNTGDSVIDRETRRMESEKAAEKRENEAMRESILGAPKRAYDAVKGMFGSTPKPAGSVTETQKSVTVTPSKKRGGMMC